MIYKLLISIFICLISIVNGSDICLDQSIDFHNDYLIDAILVENVEHVKELLIENTVLGVIDVLTMSEEEFNRSLLMIPEQTIEIEVLNVEKNSEINRPKRYQCDQCTKYSSDRFDSLKRHQKIHTGEKSHTCDKCNFKSYYPYKLVLHKKAIHDDGKFLCDKCDFKSEYSSDFKNHKELIHNPRQLLYQCDQCYYEADHPSELKRHYEKHNNRKPFRCNLNGGSFKSNFLCALVVHKKVKHPDIL